MRKLLIVFLLLVHVSLNAQQIPYNNSVFVGQPVKVGQAAKIVYDAKGGDLEFSDEVKVALYTFSKGIWRVEHFEMNPIANKKWEFSYPVEDSVLFVAAKFFQGDLSSPEILDDNVGKGYGVRVQTANGKALKGSYLAEATFIVPDLAKGAIINYYSSTPPIDKVYLQYLIAQENKLSGISLLDNYSVYLKAQKLLLNDAEFSVLANKVVEHNLGSKTISAEKLGELQLFLQHQIKEEKLAKKVSNRIVEQYPKSPTARFVAYSNINSSSKDVNELIASYEDFLQRFPITEWQENPDAKGFIYYAVYRGIATGYFDTKQFDKFQGLFKDIDFRTANELLRWNVMRAYMFKTVGRDSLYDISEPLIQLLIKKKGDNSYKDDFNTKSAADSNMNKQLDDRLFTHISLLNDVGRYAEARKYFFELSDAGKYANAELNEINMQVLDKLNLQNEILPLLEMCVKANAVTPLMFDRLKTIYSKNHNNNLEGYDEYLSTLKSNEKQAELEAYVNKHLIYNYPIPSFSMENADGGYVTQDDLKGKIVVMDFWATWCRPCIMAFPGMQLLVDKYAHDPEVSIYMVGTMQTGDYRSKSVNFVRGEGYRFTLLHDEENSRNGGQDKLFLSLVKPIFKDSSIPRKIIIKDGIIRYSSGGYSGSPSQLMDELSLAIEKLRNE